MHFRILKMIATSGFLTALECTKFDFDRGSTPDPAGGAYSAPPGLLTGLRGTASKGNGGEKTGRKGGKEVGERQGTGGMEGVGMSGKGREGGRRKERRGEREREEK